MYSDKDWDNVERELLPVINEDPEDRVYYKKYKEIDPLAGRLFLAVCLAKTLELSNKKTDWIRTEAEVLRQQLASKEFGTETEFINVLLGYWQLERAKEDVQKPVN